MNLVLKHVGTVTPDVFIPYKENVNTNDLDAKKFKTQGYLNENAPQYTRFYAKRRSFGGTIYVKQVSRSKEAAVLAEPLDMNDICIKLSLLSIINEHRS